MYFRTSYSRFIEKFILLKHKLSYCCRETQPCLIYSTSFGLASKAALNFSRDSGRFSYKMDRQLWSFHSSGNFAHRKCFCSCIVIDRYINSEVGIANLTAQEVRSFAVGIVLPDKIVVLGSGSLLVLVSGSFLQVSDPLSLNVSISDVWKVQHETYPPVDVDIRHQVRQILILATLAVILAEISG